MSDNATPTEAAMLAEHIGRADGHRLTMNYDEGLIMELREKVARAIVQADEQNGGGPWGLVMAMGKHVIGPIYDRADAAIEAVRKHDTEIEQRARDALSD